MAREALALAVFVLTATLVGCIGDDTAPGAPSEDEAGARNETPATQPGTRTIAASNGTTRMLGLATYQGIDPAAVRPHVPANMTPVPCFTPEETGRVDATLILEKRTHASLPGGEDPIDTVALVACAERPEGLAREAANEPPWVQLMAWVEGDAYVSFFEDRGFKVPAASISIEPAPRGYTLSASRDGQALVDARFVTSPVGTPEGTFFTCEPGRQDGRAIAETPDGSLVALDWNKTEAICPAQAEITWPADSPIANVLGPARTPDVVIDTRVEEARYWWRELPDPGR